MNLTCKNIFIVNKILNAQFVDCSGNSGEMNDEYHKEIVSNTVYLHKK